MNAKLLIVDDHPMLRHGLQEALGRQPGITVVGEASTGAEAVELAHELSPELVVMDLRLPDMSGVEATRQIVNALPGVKVVVFSSDESRSSVDESLEAGARGYLAKSGALEELFRALKLVMAGKLYLSPEISAAILEDYRERLANGPEQPQAKPLHSEREKQLLRLVAQGLRNKEIACQLAVSTKSVETYRSRVMKKLRCSNSAELVRYAIREGIAAP